MGLKRDFPACPTCGAAKGKTCRKANGKSAHTHKARYLAFHHEKVPNERSKWRLPQFTG